MGQTLRHVFGSIAIGMGAFFAMKIFFGISIALFVGMIFMFLSFLFINPKEDKPTVKCTNCGAEVSKSDEHCPECGTQLKGWGIECPKCKTHNKEIVKYCAKCGYRLTKEHEIGYICEYCNKKFKSDEILNNHYPHCEEKRVMDKEDKEEKINALKGIVWGIGIFLFILFGFFIFTANKINLIPYLLIVLILTSFFDKFFNRYKKRFNNLKHFEINWWKKSIIIAIITFIFVLINMAVPDCPASCNDDNLCTNDFCNKETGFKCMNTIKLNCRGNAICESGEYGTNDCPNCDDDNKCTADSYDIGAKKCINIEMKGCIK